MKSPSLCNTWRKSDGIPTPSLGTWVVQLHALCECGGHWSADFATALYRFAHLTSLQFYV